MSAIVYGASDDLIELVGDVDEEFIASTGEPTYVGLSTGVVLRVTYDRDGMWRISPLTNQSHVEIVFARGDDGAPDDDGCPSYSDKAIVSGDITWAVVGDSWAKA